LLKAGGDLDRALAQYGNELEIREKLVNKDPNNDQWKNKRQDCKAKIESLQAQGDEIGSPPQPP
jgi:hypothetical protein